MTVNLPSGQQVSASHPIDTRAAFEVIKRATYLSVTTFRKNGTPVLTPVWFFEQDGMLYFETEHDAGKIKRIRNNPHVVIAPCTASGKKTGESLDAHATILTDPADQALALAGLRKKYRGIRQVYYFILNLSMRLRGKPVAQAALCRIEPTLG
jgi:PPOX class probable F420-dependent enzyme